MPISTITAGQAVTDIKINEMIAAINALQGVAGTPIVWDFQSGTNTLTVTLTPGNWIVSAVSGAAELNGSTMQLIIDGTTMSSHFGNDDGGLNLVTLAGTLLVEITTERDVDIECINISGANFIQVMCHRTI